MHAEFKKYILNFKQPAGTSRGVLKTKETYFLIIYKEDKKGIGECGLLKGLSVDDRPDYEEKLLWVCDHVQFGKERLYDELKEFPSIQFGIEQAFLSLHNDDPFVLFPSGFTSDKNAISINGLIWLGDTSFMKEQIKIKLEAGFTTLKLKIGAIDFNEEFELIRSIRKEYTSKEIEIRVDANGAFDPENALERLKVLSDLDLHSIEQPIKAKQWESMAELCLKTPLPIALDEELIGVFTYADKKSLMEAIKPQFIILKPSLIGGFQGCDDWINIASQNDIGWWITSALESNVGLNAIAQYTFTKNTMLPQGLGTGGLFTNNFNSPLFVDHGHLYYDPQIPWNFNL
ncbi:MAG: o-succinylbenzoate synthase [Flavobacteriaceae bacterium]|nr:o-succinylbenzoate synthase [Flavobacteriaceae bacterium]